MKRYMDMHLGEFTEHKQGDWVKYKDAKQLENLIRDMLFDIPVIPDRYKYVNRLKEIKELSCNS